MKSAFYSTNDRQKEAVELALADGKSIIYANDNLLLLDFDDVEEMPNLNRKLALLRHFVGCDLISQYQSSSGGGWHAVITLDSPLPYFARIALQAVLGSDWKREMLTVLQNHCQGSAVEPVLFRPGLVRTTELLRKKK